MMWKEQLTAMRSTIPYQDDYTAETVTVGPTQARRAALMAMDLQRDFLRPDGRLPIGRTQITSVIAAMNEALQRAERQQLDVIYIANAFAPFDPFNLLRNFAAIENTRGAMLDSRILRVVSAANFLKRRRDAFSNEGLSLHLASRGVTDLIVGGVHADACVAATVKTAIRRGFKVTVLAHAVGAATAERRDRACADLARLGARLATQQS